MKGILLAGVLAAGAALGQEKVVILPLSPVDADKVLDDGAGNRSHVRFVNVGDAVEDKRFRDMVAGVSLVLPVNLAVARVGDLGGQNLFARDGADAMSRLSARVGDGEWWRDMSATRGSPGKTCAR